MTRFTNKLKGLINCLTGCHIKYKCTSSQDVYVTEENISALIIKRENS